MFVRFQFGPSQLTTEPAAVAAYSQSLLAVTNTPDKIVTSGVVPFGISVHSPIFLICKTHEYHPWISQDYQYSKFYKFIKER